MARVAKSPDNIQVFRGSRPKADVFALNSGAGCCDPGLDPSYDKLAERTRFDNALAHSNPTGANDKFRVPYGNGFSGDRDAIIAHINRVGVGAQISVLAIPTYAFVKGVGVHIAAEEPGLTFALITRNGLALPSDYQVSVAAAQGDGACDIVRTPDEDFGEGTAFDSFGALSTNLFVDIFATSANGEFSLEADELILEVLTMPAGGIVNGTFDLTVSVNYDVIHRAEQ